MGSPIRYARARSPLPKPPELNDLLAAINELGRALPKRPPGKGWETMKQMEEREGVGRGAIRFRLLNAMKRGLQIERFIGSDYDDTGALVKQTWFRVKR